MKNLGLVLGLYLKSLFGINKARFSNDPKERRRTALSIVMTLVFAVYFAAMFAGRSVLYAQSDDALGVFSLAMTLGTAITFISSMSAGYNALFAYKDHDILFSLPLTQDTISLSRLLMLYISNLVYVIMMLPGCIIVCLRCTDISWLIFPRLLLMTAAVPLIPMTAGVLLSIFVKFISVKLKLSKLLSIITNIFMLAAIAAYVMLSQNYSLTASAAVVESIYAPASWFALGIGGSAPHVILFIISSLAAAGILWLITAHAYNALNELSSVHFARGKYNADAINVSPPRRALIRREAKRFFSSHIYVMNTVVPPAIAAIGLAVLAVLGRARILSWLGEGAESILMPTALLALSFMSLMSQISSSSVSAEGSALWRILTLPVKSSDVLKAKLAFHFIVLSPITLAGSVFAAIAVGADALGVAVLIIVPQVAVVYCDIIGLMMNLKLPKLDWKNDVEFVKQGGSLAASLGICVLSFAPPLVAAVAFSACAYPITLGTGALLAAISLIVFTRMMKKSDRLFSAENLM